jgi:hypothetical protein
MRRLAKVLLTLFIGLVLVFALSTYSQTTDISASDCRDCHKSPIYDAWTTHHMIEPGCCHDPSPPRDCLTCHVSDVK